MLVLSEMMKNIINELNIPENFGCFMEDDDEHCIEAENFNCQYDNVYAAHGVSKMALVPKDENVVVKIPFNGQWCYDEQYDEENKEYYISDEAEFYSFEYAKDNNDWEDDCWDYCENELHKYELAVEVGLEMFFAETDFCCTLNGTKFYLQEKVITYNNDTTNRAASKNAVDAANSREVFKYFSHRDWLASCIDAYGVELTKKFYYFIRENGMSSDLHSGNLGWRLDGTPVLLDWAGWRD